MPEAQLVLSYLLGIAVMLALGGLAFFAVSYAKNRIIREQRKALEAEQRLRMTREAFTDNAHHELKTPLQIISGNLYLLRTLGLSPEQEKPMARAEAATQRLQDLVDGLLEWTALHQSGFELRSELVDLGSHLRALASASEARARTKGRTFQTQMELEASPVLCDWVRLRRALAALLDNALRYGAKGPITFRATTKSEGDRKRLRVEVQDEGPGLPEDWPRLMAPFEQAVRPSQVQQGLGLGLPLAAALVQRMGGQMGLVPLPQGTLAWVEVPLDEPKD